MTTQEHAPLRAPEAVVDIEADARLVNLCHALDEARDAIKRWTVVADDLKAKIIEAIGDAETAYNDDGPVVRVRPIESVRFQSSAFRADHPDLYDAYSGPSVSVRVTTWPDE